MEHKELLRKWLRGKNVHISDIKMALDWYETELAAGRNPTDDEVLDKAEDGHKRAIEGVPIQIVEKEKVVHQVVPVPFLDLDRVQKIIFGFAFGGTLTALFLFEGVKWLALAMMQ